MPLGFGQSLEKCHSESEGDKSVQEKSTAAHSILLNYLNAWDERQLIDDEESELVELFDTKISLENKYGAGQRSNIDSDNSAADSMTSFIELSSAESNRKTEIQTLFLPNRRYNCVSFMEQVCWKIIMERSNYDSFDLNTFFERCMADGSRDYGARLVSVPIHPQVRPRGWLIVYIKMQSIQNINALDKFSSLAQYPNNSIIRRVSRYPLKMTTKKRTSTI